MSNTIMVVMGIAMVFFTVGLSFGLLPKESVAFFGASVNFYWVFILAYKPKKQASNCHLKLKFY